MENKDPNEKKKIFFLILTAIIGMGLIPMTFTIFSTTGVYFKVVSLVIAEASIFTSGFIARSIKLDSDDKPKEDVTTKPPEEKRQEESLEEIKNGN